MTGQVSIAGTASDNTAVTRVEVQVDGGAFALATGTTNWTFSLDTAALAEGSHLIVARAVDRAGNSATDAISLSVDGSGTEPLTGVGPQPTITCPAGAVDVFPGQDIPSIVAAAPFVFIQYFQVPAHQFGWYFAANAIGFISVSQLNRRLVMRHGPRRVLGWGVSLLAVAGAALLVCALGEVGGFAGVLAPIFVGVGSIGLIAPNASAVAMEPFGARAGVLDHVLVRRGLEELHESAALEVHGPCARLACGRPDAATRGYLDVISDHCPLVVALRARDMDR